MTYYDFEIDRADSVVQGFGYSEYNGDTVFISSQHALTSTVSYPYRYEWGENWSPIDSMSHSLLVYVSPDTLLFLDRSADQFELYYETFRVK